MKKQKSLLYKIVMNFRNKPLKYEDKMKNL